MEILKIPEKYSSYKNADECNLFENDPTTTYISVNNLLSRDFPEALFFQTI